MRLLRDQAIRIIIDISKRKIDVDLSESEFKKRMKEEEAKGEKAFQPVTRNRVISSSLKAYALLVSSADTGAVRMI